MIDLTLDAVFKAFGEPADALVTPPNAATAIEATIVWLPATTEEAVAGEDIATRRRTAVREMALRRDQVPRVPIGTVIVAADYTGGAAKTWIVDAISRSEPDMVRVIVREVS